MSRWTPITDDDPLRVDLDQLDQQSNMYRRASLGAREAAHTLTNVSDMEHWDTDTAKAFRERAGTLARELSEVSEGMHEASYEVSMFVLRIEEYERQAKRVTEEAREKHAETNAAEADAERHRDTPPATPEEEDAHQQAMWVKKRRCQELRDELDAIERRFYRIVKDADDAATYAANKIRAAASFAPELSWWDKTKHTFSEIYDDYIEPKMDGFNNYMDRITKPAQEWCQRQTWWDGAVKWAGIAGLLASAVGLVVAIAALVVGVFFAGSLAATILGAAALVLGVLSLLSNTVGAMDGDKSKWSYAALDAVSIGVGAAGFRAQLASPKSLKVAAAATSPKGAPVAGLAPPPGTSAGAAPKGFFGFAQRAMGQSDAAANASRISKNAEFYSKLSPGLRSQISSANAAHRLNRAVSPFAVPLAGFNIAKFEKDLDRKEARGEKVTNLEKVDAYRRYMELAAAAKN